MAGKNIAENVRALALPIAESLGLRIWDVRYEKEGASWFLRIELERDGGILIDDCERMSRAIDPVLDEKDFIDGSYYLEVSSPGLERSLTRPEHFSEMTGRAIQLRLIRPLDGRRDFSGFLTGFEDGTVSIEEDGKRLNFPRKDIAFVKLDDF